MKPSCESLAHRYTGIIANLTSPVATPETRLNSALIKVLHPAPVQWIAASGLDADKDDADGHADGHTGSGTRVRK